MKHINPRALRGATGLSPLQTKDYSPDEIKKMIIEATDKIGHAFEEFKSTNDANLEKRDVVTEEKLTKINKTLNDLTGLKGDLEKVKNALDEVSAKQNRPTMEGLSPEASEHKDAFNAFLRKGHIDGLADLQQKALNITTDADGGYAVPEQLDRDIASLLVDVSPIRSVARTVTTGSSDYKKLISTGGTQSGWVDEQAPRPGTNTPQLARVQPPIGEIYTNPAATLTMLDDAFFDVEAWLAEEVQTEFAFQEGVAFISGDGVNKPRGFLTAPNSAVTDKAGRPFGTVQFIASGVANALNSADPLIDLVYSLKAGHRQTASWMMNSQTVGTVRKLKDGDGNYLWQPGLKEDEPSTLIGRAVHEAEDMPAIAADALPIALANWKAAYYVVDRMGTRVIRDPFSSKPYVHFYTTKRVGGDYVDTEAMKFLKISA